MSPRTWHERVRDILDAIAEIEEFTCGMGFEDFREDGKTLKAVELNFIIIGEAANSIPKDIQEAHTGIPWHSMRALRNRLVHAYFSIDSRIVWDTIQDELPPLAPLLKNLLPAEEEEEEQEEIDDK